MILKYILLCATLAIQSVHSARILFYFGFTPLSHRIAVWPLVEALANKGHQILFLSPHTPLARHSNVTEISPPALVDLMAQGWGNIVDRRSEKKHEKIWNEIRERGVKACEAVFEDEDTHRILVQEADFDLVFVDALYNECGMGLAYKYGAPTILYGAASVFVWQPDAHGYFPETSWIPDITKDYPLDMTFLQRVFNTLNPIYWHFGRHWNEFPDMDRIPWKYLKIRKMPPLEELEKNVSLVMINNHFSIEYPRSLPPLYVSVAGMHCEKGRKVEPLTEEIVEFINGSEDGFIYISFGSSLRFSDMNMRMQNMFLDVLKSYDSLRFVWRWEEKTRPENMSSNILTLKWVPQQALLAHPKIRAFISNAGLLSIQEAITYAVPLIAIPIYMDQDYNAEKVGRQGYGIRLEISKLRKEGLSDAISNIMNESKYTEKAAQMSTLFQDRPMRPIETAVWWTEYVLRHGTGAHLRPHAQTRNWLQRRTLDVYAFLLALVLFLLLVFYILLRQAIVMLLAFDDEPAPDPKMALRRRRLMDAKEEMSPLVEEEEGSSEDEVKSRPLSPSALSRPNSRSDASGPQSPSRPSSPEEQPPLDPHYVKSKDA